MRRIELMMHRRQIQALIKADPVKVVLRRSTRVPTPSGAWVWGDPVELRPQMVTLVPFKRRLTDIVFSNTAGQVENLPYVMVGDHTLDVRQGDTFTHNGQEFVVGAVDIRRDVRVAAEVDYMGGDPANA